MNVKVFSKETECGRYKNFKIKCLSKYIANIIYVCLSMLNNLELDAGSGCNVYINIDTITYSETHYMPSKRHLSLQTYLNNESTMCVQKY